VPTGDGAVVGPQSPTALRTTPSYDPVS
jgi:hypothetical protein